MAVYDDTAAIGKLYRRQDEIGTPWCVTVDVDSLADGNGDRARPRRDDPGAHPGRPASRDYITRPARRGAAPGPVARRDTARGDTARLPTTTEAAGRSEARGAASSTSVRAAAGVAAHAVEPPGAAPPATDAAPARRRPPDGVRRRRVSARYTAPARIRTWIRSGLDARSVSFGARADSGSSTSHDAAGVSQTLVSKVERGRCDHLAIGTVGRIFAALEADIDLVVRYRGGTLDRLLDERHAATVASVARMLQSHGWTTAVEVTFNHYGERGSIDLLAVHPVTRTALVVEAKTEITSGRGDDAPPRREGSPRRRARARAVRSAGDAHRAAPRRPRHDRQPASGRAPRTDPRSRVPPSLDEPADLARHPGGARGWPPVRGSSASHAWWCCYVRATPGPTADTRSLWRRLSTDRGPIAGTRGAQTRGCGTRLPAPGVLTREGRRAERAYQHPECCRGQATPGSRAVSSSLREAAAPAPDRSAPRRDRCGGGGGR
jgi:hypothetical protein